MTSVAGDNQLPPLRMVSWAGEPRLWWTPMARRAAESIHRDYRGLMRWLDRSRMAQTVPDQLHGLIAVAATCPGRSGGWAAVLGSPSPFRKLVMVLVDDRNRPLSVLKLAIGPQAAESLKREAAALTHLADRPHRAFVVPHMLPGIRSDCSHQSAIIADGEGRWGPAASAAWLSWLSRDATLDERKEAIARRCAALTPLAQLPTPWSAAAAPLLALAERLLKRDDLELVPWGSAHRDLTSANRRGCGDRIGVFDWEWWDPSWSPLCDLVHERRHRARLTAQADRGLLSSLPAPIPAARLAIDLHTLDLGAQYLPSTQAAGLTPEHGLCPAIVAAAVRSVSPL